MRIPRWTVWPALAVLAALMLPAIPGKLDDSARADSNSSGAPKHKKTVVLGIDGMDPDILRETIAKFPDRMRNFARLVADGGLNELGTSTPPQSPVAWSNFITGRDPGGHGIFDFIHRDPTTRDVAPSTTRTSEGSHVALWGDWQFPIGGESTSNRSGRAFWQILADHGVPADIWRMPANFPVEPALGLSFSGMMTPALDSAYGQYSFYTTNPPARSAVGEGKIVPVREYVPGLIETTIAGPPQLFRKSGGSATVPLRIYIDRAAAADDGNLTGAIAIDTGSERIVLRPGQWSRFTQLKFSLLPMGMMDVSGAVRFYLRRIEPDFELYASPINIDPLDPVMPVSSPDDASADLARAIGVYYTQGMPEDVNALKERALTDEEFMTQSELVHREGLRMLDFALDEYMDGGQGGFLFFYFSGVDLCSHMMWRHFDEAHPNHDREFASSDSSQWSHRPASTWKDVVYDLYLHMDPVLGHVRERVGEDALLIVMSDHGFAPYRRVFSLNTWLVENDYLVLKPGETKELPRDDPNFKRVYLKSSVDWSKTRAYGMGFNALYLNLAGRELDDPATPENEAGIVRPGAEAEALVRELKDKLEAVRDGAKQVVFRCDIAAEIYHGERASEAPDLLVGYNAEYGNSDFSSTGRIPNAVLDDNMGGTFNGNHLMSPEVVKGTLLTNGRVLGGSPLLEDLTVEILKQYGIAPESGMRGAPVLR